MEFVYSGHHETNQWCPDVNEAVLQHKVPATTLKDRISGTIIHGTNPGLKCYLGIEEENELSDFLKGSALVGYGRTRMEVMNIAQSVADQKGLLRKDKISSGWWRRFRERQGDLSLRRGDNTASIRMDAVNEVTMNNYFQLLEKTLKENNLMNSPAQIYNVDETGIPLDPKAPNIVAKTGTKKVRYQSTGRKGQITVTDTRITKVFTSWKTLVFLSAIHF